MTAIEEKGFEVETEVSPNGDINQRVYAMNDGQRKAIISSIMHTCEQQTREGLIALGWTPPSEDK